MLQRDPVLNPLYYVGRQDVPPGSFDRSTASLRVGGPVFFAGIAHERLRIGPSADRPLILADGADYFSTLQLGLSTRVIQYRFIHGALGDRSRYVPGDSVDVLLGPERYLALHRLDFAGLNARPLWDALMLPLIAGIALVCGLGVWMGWRRLTRHERVKRPRRH